jgi:hypothetical protein
MPPKTAHSHIGTAVNIGLVAAGFALMAYQVRLFMA